MKAGRKEKLTWEKIYKDFRKRYPKIAKDCGGFRPYGWGEILIYGMKDYHYIYNYDRHEAKIVNKKDVIF